MKSRTDKITDSIVRISVAPAGDFAYNMFLILSQRPVLIHTGREKWFKETLSRASEHLDPSKLEVIVFSHFEADECGALNSWFEIAPHAEVYSGMIGQATLEDFSIKPPRIVRDGGMINLGNRQLILLETPHFPHNWDSCLFYDQKEKVLFSSDVGAHVGFDKIFMGEDDLDQIMKFQKRTGFMTGGKYMQKALSKIRALDIEILAIHHGASLKGKQAILKFFDRLEAELT